MKASELDFSAVTYSHPYELVKKSELLGSIILGVVGFLAAVILGVLTNSVDIAGWVIAMIAFGLSARVAKLINVRKKAIWAAFAKDNGFSIATATERDLPPSVMKIGYYHVYRDAVVGYFSGVEHKLFEYSYQQGSGKNRRTYTLTILRLKMSKNFPHFVLNSTKNYGGARVVPSTAEHISLEGDFDSVYRLYIDRTKAVDVLSVLTPDVMQTLMTSTKTYDVEVFNDAVYLFVEGDKRSKKYVADLYNGAEALLGELLHKQKSLAIREPIVLDSNNVKSLDLRDALSSKVFKYFILVFIIFVAITFIMFVYAFLNFEPPA